MSSIADWKGRMFGSDHSKDANTYDAGFIDILGRTFHLEEVRFGCYCQYGSLTRSLKAATALFAPESTGEGGATSPTEDTEPFYSREVSTKGHGREYDTDWLALCGEAG